MSEFLQASASVNDDTIVSSLIMSRLFWLVYSVMCLSQLTALPFSYPALTSDYLWPVAIYHQKYLVTSCPCVRSKRGQGCMPSIRNWTIYSKKGVNQDSVLRIAIWIWLIKGDRNIEQIYKLVECGIFREVLCVKKGRETFWPHQVILAQIICVTICRTRVMGQIHGINLSLHTITSPDNTMTSRVIAMRTLFVGVGHYALL